MSDTVVTLRPRAERQASNKLGLYIRAGFNSQKDILESLSAGHSGFHGVVFDAANIAKQNSLVQAVRNRPLDAILDPQTLALGFEGGRTKTTSILSWAGTRAHRPDDFDDDTQRDIARKIAQEVVRHGFTGVISPTHFLLSGDDPWLSVDANVCGHLKTELARLGCSDVIVLYLASMPMAVFRKPQERSKIIAQIPSYAADAIWLRIANFGNDATGPGLEAYLDGARDFHRLGLPVVADHIGGLIGLSSVAFGAVGGICHGVSIHERFEVNKWRRPSSSSSGGSEKRVYIPSLDIHLGRSDAEVLFAAKGAATRFGCLNTEIAPRGIKDMINRPGPYFVAQRIHQIESISAIPESIRASEFVEREVRPLTDSALWAARANLNNEDLTKKFENNRIRLDRLRPIFGSLSDRSSNQAFAVPPPIRFAVSR